MIFTANELMKEMFIDITEQVKRGTREPSLLGFSTGFSVLDRMLGGLAPGELFVLGGRPGSGKTALLTAIVANQMPREAPADGLASDSPHVLFIDLETSGDQLMRRLLAAVASLDISRLRAGAFLEDDFRRLVHAATRISHGKLAIVDRRHLTLPRMVDLIHRHWASVGLPRVVSTLRDDEGELDQANQGYPDSATRISNPAMILIDGLQELGLGAPCRTRDEEVARVVSGLKTIAREFGCPVVVTSRVNRRWDTRNDPTPRIPDLRDSGTIEDVADVVLFLEYPIRAVDAPPLPPGETAVDMIVAKNRNGPRGRISTILETPSGCLRESVVDHPPPSPPAPPSAPRRRASSEPRA